MADGTKIEWAHAGLGRGATINPIRAVNRRTLKRGWFCEKVSPACDSCYAERLNMKPGASGGTGLPYKPGHRKDVTVFLHQPALEQMLRWREPRGIFWCSMTDVFADFVTDEMIEVMLAHMICAPRHRHLLLTKRPERAASFLEGWFKRLVARDPWIDHPGGPAKLHELVALDELPRTLPFIWIGATVEDQRRADERREPLRAIAQQGWTTFVSHEPALGRVDWTGFEFLAWLIAGGETGPQARPSHPDWLRAARDWAAANGVAFHFKQWGDWLPGQNDLYEGWKYPPHLGGGTRRVAHWQDGGWGPRDTRNPSRNYVTWDDAGLLSHGERGVGDLREIASWASRVGKAKAGRMLDGRTHDEFPEVI